MKSNRLQLHTPSSSATAQWDKYETKNYLHFDTPLHIKRMKKFIQDSEWVQSHAFLPFINFNITFNKYVLKEPREIVQVDSLQKNVKEKEEKTRSIMYASHIDQFIYKYYGELLNNSYNAYVKNTDIDDVVLAYRNNKKGKSNLDFSAEVFQYVLSQDQAVIISLDFSGFFDNITHKKLKENIKTVLNKDELPADIYHVFKNTTKYSYVAKTQIDKFLLQKYGEDQLKSLKKNRQLKRIMSDAEFRAFKKKHLFKNKKPFGIPQGSGMSAVCSNIHLIEFDKEVADWAAEYNALYRRYSDDLILVIPTKLNKSAPDHYINEIMKIIEKYKNHGLDVQQKKTEIRIFKDEHIYDLDGRHSSLDYLGLVMDGKNVQLREKSLFKYYSRAYRKAKVCKNITLKTGKKYERRKLYKIYTHLGFDYKGQGNFIKYAKRAHFKMESIGLKSNIHNQTKRHWNKIHKVLN